MHAHNDLDQFAPPRPPARLRAVSLAVLVHLVLIGALTWGVSWKNSADQPAVEAELWAAVPQQAAPRAVEPPPPPPTPEVRQPAPTPAPPPPPRAAEPPDTREADIAIEREKKRLEQEKKAREQQLEREKRERERKEAERRERLEQEKKERQQKEKEQREKQLAEQKRAEQEKQKKLAEDKRRKAEEAAREAKEADARHQANIRRMQGLANATGGETATGTALDSSGPSASYGGRVAAAVKPNIVFTENVAGNPSAEVEVRAAPDGTITSRRLLKSSGVKAWDEAVLRALDKTERLPKDTDGRVPPQIPMVFRPKD